MACLNPSRLGGFNTQPPEGGWDRHRNHQDQRMVSTHSRLKAAGPRSTDEYARANVSTHSRLKAAEGG